MVFSIATEFIENDDENVTKQDCEIKAFKRLAAKLKSKYPNCPICMLGDILYTCEPVFKICDGNKWGYLLRFKEGRISSVAKEFNILKEFDGKKNKDCTWVKNIEYNQRTINFIEADILRQLYEKGVDKIRDLNKSIKEISSILLESFRMRLLTNEDIQQIEKRMQIRFL